MDGSAGRSHAVSGAAIAVVMLFAFLPGCVERKLLIRSDPPGADIYIDEEFRGTTPLDVPFTFYRARLIELRKEGFEPQRFLQSVPPPFYQIIPLDFVFEVLVPFTLVDEHPVERRLKPESPEMYDRRFMERLRERGEAFREP